MQKSIFSFFANCFSYIDNISHIQLYAGVLGAWSDTSFFSSLTDVRENGSSKKCMVI